MVDKIDKVAYLSMDMKDGEFEIAALKFFLDKLAPGVIVYFDDYLWGYEKLQKSVDEFLAVKNVKCLHIPTGNSKLIKNENLIFKKIISENAFIKKNYMK